MRTMFSELAAMNHNCPNWFVSKTVFRRIAGAQEKHDAKHYPESASTNLPICRAMWRGCVPLGISGVWASSARICTIGFRLALCRRLEANLNPIVQILAELAQTPEMPRGTQPRHIARHIGRLVDALSG